MQQIKLILEKIKNGGANQTEIELANNWLLLQRINNFSNYCKFMIPEFDWQWYHDIIMNKIQQLIDSGRGNLIIELPPQHGKTAIAGILLTSYIFGRFPEKRLVYATYNEERAKDVVQNEILPLIMSDRYSEVFPNSKIKWNVDEELDSKIKKKKEATALGFSNVNSNRGGFKAAGRRTMLTGKPAHLLIIDDYFKDDSEAFSPKIRDQVWNWYATTARTRQQTNTIKIVFATRWHSDDLIGRIKKENELNQDEADYIKWEILTFPALKEAHHANYDYDKRSVGEYLDINKRHLYAEFKTDIRAWKALCQQEPLDEKGLIFQRDYFHQYETLPEIQQVYISIDTNFTKTAKHGDDCGITLWGINNHRYYLLDFYNAKYNFIELKNKVVELIRIYPNYTGILVELKANGAALVDELNQYFPRVYGIDPANKSKLQRAQYVLDEFVNSRVFVPTKRLNPRIDIFIEQLCQFTGQKDGVDDLVDSTTMFLGYVKHNIIKLPSLDSLEKLAIPNLANKIFGRSSFNRINTLNNQFRLPRW
ncbi:MAG: terminase large subunit domain-containing protein [Neisseriaceae bacterium]